MRATVIRHRKIAILVLTCAVGCTRGDGITRVEVSGMVRYLGEPVPDGQIRFIPDSATAGPVTIKSIANGRYECKEHGGLPVGAHRVEILSWDPASPRPRGPGAEPRTQWLPPKYNQQTTLSLTVADGKGPIEHDFDLTE